jgi:hypothetical protein
MSKVQNNASVVSACNQRLVALAKYVKAKTDVEIAGEPNKLADLVAVYQATLDTRSAVLTKRAELKKALVDRRSAEAARKATDVGLKAWVAVKFGADSQEATEFGLTAPKAAVKSVETKYVAIQQSQATREARGTKGKKQKKSIKGVIATPAAPADPATTAPTAAPAVVATNGASAPHS